MNGRDEFNDHIEGMQKSLAARPFIGPLVDVADTANGCLTWFRSRGLEPTAADVVAMAQLVLDYKEREDLRRERENVG